MIALYLRAYFFPFNRVLAFGFFIFNLEEEESAALLLLLPKLFAEIAV
jgi:hypothetical protein